MYLRGMSIHTAMGEASRVYSISLLNIMPILLMLYRSFISSDVAMIDYIIGTLDVLHACDACADIGMAYSVIVQCTDCVVFPRRSLWPTWFLTN